MNIVYASFTQDNIKNRNMEMENILNLLHFQDSKLFYLFMQQ